MSALALPLAAGLAGAGSAAFGWGGARARAKGMFPDEYARRLEELKRLKEKGFGLDEGHRAEEEARGVAQRGGLSAQHQARGLQAASMASGRALSGRDLFVQEMGLQDALAQHQGEEARRIAEMDRMAAAAQRQEMMELAQREADSEAARKSANRQLLADLAGTAGTVAVGAIGAKARADAFDQTLSMQARRKRVFEEQAATSMLTALGGQAASAPIVPYIAPPPMMTPAPEDMSRLTPEQKAYFNLDYEALLQSRYLLGHTER